MSAYICTRAVDPKQLEVLQLSTVSPELSTRSKADPAQSYVELSVDVDKVAKLASLRIKDEERESIAGELRAIIAFADKLNDINTDGVAVTSHVVPIVNVFREDAPQKSLERELVLYNAPMKNDSYVIVPKTVD